MVDVNIIQSTRNGQYGHLILLGVFSSVCLKEILKQLCGQGEGMGRPHLLTVSVVKGSLHPYTRHCTPTSASSVAEEMISLRSCRLRITWPATEDSCMHAHTHARTHTHTHNNNDHPLVDHRPSSAGQPACRCTGFAHEPHPASAHYTAVTHCTQCNRLWWQEQVIKTSQTCIL